MKDAYYSIRLCQSNKRISAVPNGRTRPTNGVLSRINWRTGNDCGFPEHWTVLCLEIGRNLAVIELSEEDWRDSSNMSGHLNALRHLLLLSYKRSERLQNREAGQEVVRKQDENWSKSRNRNMNCMYEDVDTTIHSVIQNPDVQGRINGSLTAKVDWSCGRSPRNDIVFESRSVQRQAHTTIICRATTLRSTKAPY